MWARSELRRRWPALVVLGLLAGVTTGLAAAAVAGARRTDSAEGRLRNGVPGHRGACLRPAEELPTE
jgi:hypothetical protein